MKKIDYQKYGEILKALGHPVRLHIVDGLSSGNECNVNKIVNSLKIPQSTVSQHLRVLKNSGVIAFKKKGTQACYRVVNDRVLEILNILKQ